MDVRRWFDQNTPRPRVASNWSRRALEERDTQDDMSAERRCVWIGGSSGVETLGKRARLCLAGAEQQTAVTLSTTQAIWLKELLDESRLRQERGPTYPLWREVRETFPGTSAELASFMKQPSWRKIRAAGLLLV